MSLELTETKLFGGMFRDFCPDILGFPKSLRKKSLCSIFGPNFCPFWDFPEFSGIFPIFSGFSRLVVFLFLGLVKHLRGTVPKGSATQSGPFPKKVGNPAVWKPPGLASSLKPVSGGNIGPENVPQQRCPRTPARWNGKKKNRKRPLLLMSSVVNCKFPCQDEVHAGKCSIVQGESGELERIVPLVAVKITRSRDDRVFAELGFRVGGAYRRAINVHGLGVK